MPPAPPVLVFDLIEAVALHRQQKPCADANRSVGDQPTPRLGQLSESASVAPAGPRPLADTSACRRSGSSPAKRSTLPPSHCWLECGSFNVLPVSRRVWMVTLRSPSRRYAGTKSPP